MYCDNRESDLRHFRKATSKSSREEIEYGSGNFIDEFTRRNFVTDPYWGHKISEAFFRP